MQSVLRDLQEQLEGILDPISKLSKMIWFHLRFNDSYRGYARLLLLECRSNRSFYTHDAYALIRKYAGIMLGILDDGVRKGVFRPDLNLRLVREAIFGLLDRENIDVLATREIKEGLSDFSDILSLILPAICKPNGLTEATTDKRTRILEVAETVFASKGYNQATISEIARLSEVSEGTIYGYFRNKEDILFSISEQRFNEHMGGLQKVFEITAPLEKLRHILAYHFFLYLEKRNFLKIFMLDMQLNQRFYSSHVYPTFQKYTHLITDVMEEGKKAGCIRGDINNRVFVNLFIGAFCHMALRWMIVKGQDETDKLREIDEMVSLLTRAVAVQQQ
jgi:TetR/AcrR family fatty acid metabolism transcriptional regulator